MIETTRHRKTLSLARTIVRNHNRAVQSHSVTIVIEQLNADAPEYPLVRGREPNAVERHWDWVTEYLDGADLSVSLDFEPIEENLARYLLAVFVAQDATVNAVEVTFNQGSTYRIAHV